MRAYPAILREVLPSPRHGVVEIVKNRFYPADYSESGPYTVTTVCRGMDSGSECDRV